MMTPISVSRAASERRKRSAGRPMLLPLGPIEVRIGQHVGHVNRSLLDCDAFRSRHRGHIADRVRANILFSATSCERRTGAVHCRLISRSYEYSAEHSLAARLDDGVEHRLHVVGERLITLRTSLVAVCCSSDSVSSRGARLHLVEQPHVLDRDHRLVGERRRPVRSAFR